MSAQDRTIQVPACDLCSVGVMDSTNPHLLGTCPCLCHAKNAEDVVRETIPTSEAVSRAAGRFFLSVGIGNGGAAFEEVRAAQHAATLASLAQQDGETVSRLWAILNRMGEICAKHSTDQLHIGAAIAHAFREIMPLIHVASLRSPPPKPILFLEGQ